MSFNKDHIAKVMDLYNCNRLFVDREGRVFAEQPHMPVLIPGMMFDTDTMDGTEALLAIENAKKE